MGHQVFDGTSWARSTSGAGTASPCLFRVACLDRCVAGVHVEGLEHELGHALTAWIVMCLVGMLDVSSTTCDA